ncbi:MAG TPA: chromate transporter, partial [Patescibacteria group bacterium]|nr:chromate transporter [Patescibacteria group bacterium]
AHSPYPHRVTFAEATRFWVKLGFISFGGPAGQIAIMHRELVEKKRWIGERRFLHALNYCMLLPGPEATQLAIYIGWLLHRFPGGIVAGAFFVIPSIFVLLLLSYIYAAFGALPAIAALFAGVKPVVVAIVVEAVVRIGRRALARKAHYLIAAAAFISIYFLHVPFPLIVLVAGLIGLAGSRLRPDLFSGAATRVAPAPATGAAAPSIDSSLSPAGAVQTHQPAAVVLDDDAPSPPHALPSRARSLRTLLVGLVLWIVPLGILAAARGWRSLHVHEYRFFTQAALVTFGGAYAVLAYVTQAAVESYGWITHAQALDGLALAETTPGPLIMVLQFVGFMAGWNHPEGMVPAASATIGALVTTWTTFLPCFVFIFLGAPFIEVLRGNRDLTGALSGVTASVVGVVLNLALVFGTAVIWPGGATAGIDWFAAAVTAAAFIALYRFRLDVLWLVLAGALAGAARAFCFS